MIELFKDNTGYVIRKGILRNYCCVDTLTEKELVSLAKKILKKFKIKTFEDFKKEVEQDKKNFI